MKKFICHVMHRCFDEVFNVRDMHIEAESQEEAEAKANSQRMDDQEWIGEIEEVEKFPN
jgi:hypothetical protein